MSKPKKNRLKDIILLSVLLIIVIFGLWFMVLSKDNIEITDIFTDSLKSKKIEQQKLPSKEIFDNTLEQDSRFNNLKDFREIPDSFSEPGRNNPFVKTKSSQ